MPDLSVLPSMPDPARWFEQAQRIMGPGNAGYPLPTEPPPEYARAMQQSRPVQAMPTPPQAPPMAQRPGPGMGAMAGSLPVQLAMLMGGSSSPDVQRFYEQRGAQGMAPGGPQALPPQQQPQIPVDVLLRWLITMLSPRGPEAAQRPGLPPNQP